MTEVTRNVSGAVAGQHATRMSGRLPLPTEVPGDDDWPTAGAPKPAQPYDLWTRVNVGENLPHPVTPLTLSSFGALFGGMEADGGANGPFEGDDVEMAHRWFGRVYFNEGAVRHQVASLGLPATLLDRAWGAKGRPDPGAAHHFRPLRFMRSLPRLLTMMRPKRRKPSATAAKTRKLKPEQRFAAIDEWVAEFQRRDLDALDDRAVLDELTQLWHPRYAEAFQAHVGASLGAVMSYLLVERATMWRGGAKARAHDLVTGLAGIHSATIGPALWRMATTLRAAGLDTLALSQPAAEALASLRAKPEAQAFLDQLDGFLVDHGHRCVDEVELLHPRWVEAPDLVLEMVAGYLRAGDALDPLASEEASRRLRRETTTAVMGRLDPARRAIFRLLLKRAQQAVRLRDNSRDAIIKVCYPMRHLYAELGRRWAARGWLGAPDDIFFLVLDEIAELAHAGELRAVGMAPATAAARRRAAYDFWFTVVAPDVLGPNGMVTAEAEPVPGLVIAGLPASGGRAQGRARVILDPREAGRIVPGDILVARATDPGWTPIFPLVRGVVLEIGGQLSHGAIVAREYGIPAVVNAAEATRVIQDGQTITVDGNTGTVLLE